MNNETNSNAQNNEAAQVETAAPVVIAGAKRARAKWMSFGGLIGAAAGVAGTLAFQAYRSGAAAPATTTEG